MPYTPLFLIALLAYTATRMWLNHRQQSYVAANRHSVPEDFSDKIDLEAHQKAADYTQEKTSFNRWNILFDGIVLLLWTIGGGIELVSQWVNSLGLSTLWSGTVTIIAVLLISSLLEMPFSLHRTFVIEQKFGFNRTTPKLVVIDTLKGFALALVLGLPLIMLVLWLLQVAGSAWWFYAWAFFMGFGLFVNWAFPIFIAPMFNTFTPLEDEELKHEINNLLSASGFASNGIYVVDGSRRSGHGNAYFAGFGKSKRIVFYDTLLESLDQPQVLAVLAHELGHFHHKHILKNLIVSSLTSLIGFGLLAWLLTQESFFSGLGIDTPTTATGLLLFMMVIPTFTFFIGPLAARLSRKHEFEADRFAASKTKADDLVSALVKMYQDNASTLTPDPLHSSFYDSHPPASERIRHLHTCPSAG